MEDNDASVLQALLKDATTSYLTDWKRTNRLGNDAYRRLWEKIKETRSEDFSHRAYMRPRDFVKGLRQYLMTVERLGEPSALIERESWQRTWDNLDGIWWFGDLARFDYLRRICPLHMCECPDELPHSGKGPLKGLRMIYGSNATLGEEGNHLLELLRSRTKNPQVVFHLEDVLCLMHYQPINSDFQRYFRNHALSPLVAQYLAKYGDGRRCYARPKHRCFSQPRRNR